MVISDFAIRKPVITTVVMIAIVVFGIAALTQLKTDEFPEVTPPVVSASIPYPGASPAVVEREIVDPIEEAVQSISGVKRLRSTSLDGFAVLVIEFEFSKDPQQATQDVRDKISEIRSTLPPEMKEPILTRFDPADLPIVSITLSSDRPDPAALTQLADPGIKRKLTALPGVADVTIVGGVERELSVDVRPDALAAAGIGIADVVRVLGTENLAAPVGRLTQGATERTIRLSARPRTPQEFAQIVVSRGSAANDRVVRLGDIADVRDGSAEARSAAFYNERSAVGIDIKKALGYSTTEVAARIRAQVEALQRELPAGTRLDIVRDAGARVSNSVHDVERTLLQGAALTVLVVFMFLRSWRSTVITGLALPVSVIASFVAVWLWGFTLNTMSLLGLSLAIGILVDDAIVVRENIVRHMEAGHDHLRAAREGTSEIGLAVTATTLSIVVVFVPIAFMGGIAQQWFAPFALTLACSVLVSLFVSFSLDPMLSAVWADPEVAGKRSWLSRKLAWFDRGIDRGVDGYRHVIRWALGHRKTTVLIAIATFVLSLALPAVGLVGSAFFPETDESEFQLNIETPAGSSLAYTRDKVQAVSALARKHGEVAYTYAAIGGTTEVVDEATLYVRLKPRADRSRTQAEVLRDLRRELAGISGVIAYVPNGFSGMKQIELQLVGPDVAVLDRIASEVAGRIRAIPGIVDVGLSSKGQRPEVVLTPDRDAAGQLGIHVGDVAQAMRPAFAGVDAGDWVDPTGETRDVTVRLVPEARERPEDLAQLSIPVPQRSELVPLGQLGRLSEGVAPAQIEHLDGVRVVSVGANAEGQPLSAVNAGIERALANLDLPPGYERRTGGETEDQQEVFGRIFTSLGIAILLMYFVLVIQFGSFLDPIPIMMSLPLSLIGVMLAMLVSGATLNLMSMIGVILLMGLVAKNAILLIDFAKRAQKAQRGSREDALVEAGAVRFRPIVMTSVAVIAGMLPVALGRGEGGDFRAPLGLAVIGGVITSTILTLLVIPTFYDMVANARDRMLARLRRRRQH